MPRRRANMHTHTHTTHTTHTRRARMHLCICAGWSGEAHAHKDTLAMLPAPMKPILLHMLRSSCEEKNRTPSAGAREHCVRMHALRECLRTSERTSERAAPAHTCNARTCANAQMHARRARAPGARTRAYRGFCWLRQCRARRARAGRRPPASLCTGESRKSVYCEYAHW